MTEPRIVAESWTCLVCADPRHQTECDPLPECRQCMDDCIRDDAGQPLLRPLRLQGRSHTAWHLLMEHDVREVKP